MQFARYLPLIVAGDGQAVLACEPPLLPLLARLPGVRVVAKDAPLPRYDAWIDQMSLPHVFATRRTRSRRLAGYLHADPARVARWRERLPRRGEDRAGLGAAIRRTRTTGGGRCRRMPMARLLAVCGSGARQPAGRTARASEPRLPDFSSC